MAAFMIMSWSSHNCPHHSQPIISCCKPSGWNGMKVDDNDTIRIITVTYEYIIPWYHYPIIVSYSEWLSSQSQLFTIATQKRIFHSDEKCFQNGIDDVFICSSCILQVSNCFFSFGGCYLILGPCYLGPCRTGYGEMYPLSSLELHPSNYLGIQSLAIL